MVLWSSPGSQMALAPWYTPGGPLFPDSLQTRFAVTQNRRFTHVPFPDGKLEG